MNEYRLSHRVMHFVIGMFTINYDDASLTFHFDNGDYLCCEDGIMYLYYGENSDKVTPIKIKDVNKLKLIINMLDLLSFLDEGLEKVVGLLNNETTISEIVDELGREWSEEVFTLDLGGVRFKTSIEVLKEDDKDVIQSKIKEEIRKKLAEEKPDYDLIGELCRSLG